MAEILTFFALAGLSAAAAFALDLLGLAAASVLSLLLGAATVIVAMKMRLGRSRWWLVPSFSLLTATLGALGTVLLFDAPKTLFLAPACAAAGAGFAEWTERIGRRRCGLCSQRTGLKELLFTCPRCSLAVCDRRCWDFDLRRCRLCTENGVPLLLSGDQWWNRTFGPRTALGRCRACLATHEERDLRACGSCRRPLCREDWDRSNGECDRCGWVCPDLPASLLHVAVQSGDGNPVTSVP